MRTIVCALNRPARGGVRAGLFLIGLLLASPAAFASGEASVDFVSPMHLQTVIGETPVELRVELPPGVEVEQLILLADGDTVAILESAPWETTWNAGDSGRSHRLQAVLLLSDGTEARASIRTSPLRITYYEDVALVNLYATVRDARGNYVSDLTRGNFRITEDGRPEEIDRFSTERKPLRVGIVLDTSLTMEGSKLNSAKKAALGFLEVLERDDEGMVVTFSDEVRVDQDLTHDRDAMASSISSVSAKGGTALYDAVWRTSKKLREFDGRRVMVLLSDGRDEAANGLEPGSLHTLEEALDRALRDEVMIFAIGFGRNLGAQMDFYGRRSLKSILEEMAAQTGGRALFPARAGRLKAAFEQVADDLRNHYSLAYVSDDPDRDGEWREIRLSTDRPDLTVYTRSGYYAASERAAARSGS
jgi:VWFA-related protein